MKEYCFSVIVYENNKDVFVGYLKTSANSEEEAKQQVHEELMIEYPNAGNIVIKKDY